jgi:hypothetical protein
VTEDEQAQLRLIASAEDHLAATIASVTRMLELEPDPVRQADLRILASDLKKQARRVEQFSRRLRRKERECERLA